VKAVVAAVHLKHQLITFTFHITELEELERQQQI
jgi:hypothetical protein